MDAQYLIPAETLFSQKTRPCPGCGEAIQAIQIPPPTTPKHARQLTPPRLRKEWVVAMKKLLDENI